MTGPRRRHPPEVRRRLILESALECIAERGLAHTTVRDIAARAGISTGTITYHFASIDEILGEVLCSASTRFTEAFLREARQRTRSIDRLYYVIDVNLPDHPDALALWRLWLDLWARAARDPELGLVHSERHAVERDALEGLIREGIAAGEFLPVDARRVAREFLGLLDGLGLQAAIGDREMDVEEARALLRSALEARLLPRG